MTIDTAQLHFRHSTPGDLPMIMPVYARAKAYMRNRGNMQQWTGGYPSADVIAADIANGNHYVGEDDAGRLAVVFAFILGDDPTYDYVDGGSWPENCPYGTIHRIASTGLYPKMLDRVLEFCFLKTGSIRIDTHAHNQPMLDAINRTGFTRAGIIYLADGSPRTAFQKTLKL